MGTAMKQIAIYGKGGIGKSTISANISYQLSKGGLKVAQIGCDPKHDSTRLLLNGKSQRTVLEHINSGSKDAGDTVSIGKNGTICVETGGPEPGVGCAGRGILTAFNFMESNSVIDPDTDVMLYDVLGDVVCGGFAVPLRRKYANAVFIVTSGEFMSLYAANNVLKGIRNFDGNKSRVAGLILNMRGNEGEYEYVKNFADAVGLPIVTKVPRSPKFSQAESEGVTVSEKFPDSEEASAIARIADIIRGLLDGKGELHPALPLNDDELDMVAKGIKVVRNLDNLKKERTLAVDERNALRGCGSVVSCSCCMGIRDADIIIHGPKSCHYYFSSGMDGNIVFEGKASYLRCAADRIFCTDLTDYSSIFGGIKQLEALIEERIAAESKAVFVITTCVPGIIGDDVNGLCERMQEKYPDAVVLPIEADGILNGPGMNTREITLRKLFTLVRRDVPADGKSVNIIGYDDTPDKAMMRSDDTERLLSGLGLRINCRVLHENTLEEFRDIARGSIDLMFGYSVRNRQICRIMKEELGIPYWEEPMPVGMRQTEEWIESFGKSMGATEEQRSSLIASFRRDYDAFAERTRDRFKGMKAVLYIVTASDIDWLFEIMDILGIEATHIFSPVNNKWRQADEVRFAGRDIRMEFDMDFDDLRERVEEIKPDMVLGNVNTLCDLDIPHASMSTPRIGVRSMLERGERIIRMLEVSRL